jgi:hypothetical protein
VQASRVTVVCDTGLDGAAAWLAWRVAGILFAGGTLCRAGDSGDQSGCNRNVARFFPAGLATFRCWRGCG